MVAPLGAALVVDDPDAVSGLYIHWIVAGIAPGPGSTADGQTPAGGTVLPNTAGQTRVHRALPAGGHRHPPLPVHALPAPQHICNCPPGLAGAQAVQAIAGAATAQAQLTGTFGS